MEKNYDNPRNGIGECLYYEADETIDENVEGLVLANGVQNGIGAMPIE